jgi:UDP-glucose 4-epimerase
VRTLVTGGAGFIGSHIVDLLVAEGHEVAVVDNLASGKRSNLDPRARLYVQDVVDADGLRRVLEAERPEVVFHEAAQMSVKVSTDRPIYDAEVNVIGLLNLLEGCVATGVRKVLFAGSGATYGNPDYLPIDEQHPQRPAAPYGITKMVAEHYLRYYAADHGLHFTSLRYGNVYGPRQDAHGEAGVVAIFANQLLSDGTPMIHWDGEQTRDYVHAADVARANLLAAAPGKSDDQCYCIGTGVGATVNRIYELVSREVGVKVEPRHGPRRPGDLRAAYFDTTRARNDLGWQAQIPLESGLADTVAWFRRALTATPVGVG